MQHMLIVATSGRALAQCAARSGFSSVVLDCFADADTREVARSADTVPDASGIALDPLRVLETAEMLSPPEDTDALVYGAGFESDPALLERFASRYRLCGNSPEVIRLVKDPATLFELLDDVGLPHPETRTERPACGEGWLVKKIGGTGGFHVRRCGERPCEPNRDYFQREVRGTVCSALFLADHRGARILGISEALPPGDGVRAPYAYSGAVSHAAIPPHVREDLALRLDALVALTGMVGLNGVDFVVDGDAYFVLEVNPRPTATIELYDPDIADGLLRAHVAACSGGTADVDQIRGPVRGHAIVFARNPVRLPAGWKPAPWCADIPHPEAVVAPGMPICSVRAEGHSHADVVGKIARYRSAVLESCEEIAA